MTTSEAQIAVQVRIEGRVQGVGYRAWADGEARARGLEGWVRNRSDGSVEALFSGTRDAVGGMLLACMKGPMAARVESVRPFPASPPEMPGFRTLPTM